MDRFIEMNDVKMIVGYRSLKSNMDRFIDQKFCVQA